MQGRCILGEGNSIAPISALRVEEAKLKARGVKPLGCLRYKLFADQTLMDRVGQRVEAGSPDTAGEIGACLQRKRGRVRNVRSLLVALIYIHDGAAVGDDEAFEAPGVAQVLLEQHLVGARGKLVDGGGGAGD